MLYFRDARTRSAESRGQLLFARIKFVAPRSQLWFLLHNFISSRLLILRSFTILSNFHELLLISKCNTAVVLRGLSSTVLKIYAALAASRPTRRYKNSSAVTTTLFSNSSTVFISSTTLLFALSHFVFFPKFSSLPSPTFIFISTHLFPASYNGGKRSGYHALLFLIIFFRRRSNSELRFRDVHETLFIFSHILRCRAFIDDALFSRRTHTLVWITRPTFVCKNKVHCTTQPTLISTP